MKYIHDRQSFLNNIKDGTDNLSLNETLENDISWGGSYLGRLINSTIRLGVKYLKTGGIPILLKQLENEILSIIVGSETEVENYKVKFLLNEIFKIVNSKESVSDKLLKLLGKGDDGIIDKLIGELEKLNDFPDKSEIIIKLKRFKDELSNTKKDDESEEDSDKDVQVKENDTRQKKFLKSSFDLLRSLVDINRILKLGESSFNLNPEESQARAALRKLISSAKSSNLEKTTQSIDNLLKKWDEGGEYQKEIRKIIAEIIKQIIKNEKTLGNPIKFEDLIKENFGVIPTQYSDIPKGVSLISKVILGFKEDIGILGALSPIKKPITQFINSYDIVRKIILNKKINENFIKEEFENDTDDIVKKAWYKVFKEGEEKKWFINESEVRKMANVIDKSSSKARFFDEKSNRDPVVRIVRIFGKAYSLYATDYIPSGRPGGEISQSTMREYRYIGNGSVPTLQKGSGPGYGPWAARVSYDMWQNGVMKILENPKYKKALESYKLKKENKQSGLTLFTFINDMLSEDGNFRKRRKEILSRYFEEHDMIEKESGRVMTGNLPIQEKDRGDDELVYFQNEIYKLNTDYSNKFLRIEYKMGGNTEYLIAYVFGKVKIGEDENYIIKFHKSKDKQSLINDYLQKDTKIDKSLEYDPDKQIFIGIIPLKKFKDISKIPHKILREFKNANELSGFQSGLKIEVLKKNVNNSKTGKQTQEYVVVTNPRLYPKNDDSSIKLDEKIIDKIKG